MAACTVSAADMKGASAIDCCRVGRIKKRYGRLMKATSLRSGRPQPIQFSGKRRDECTAGGRAAVRRPRLAGVPVVRHEEAAEGLALLQGCHYRRRGDRAAV